MSDQPAFIVTTGGPAGARLSRVGQWGNLPFVDVASAEAEARRIGGDGVTIEHRVARRVRR